MTDTTTKPFVPFSARWTRNETITKQVRTMWDGGCSAKRIAVEMGQRYRVVITRNAVLGFIHRKSWQLSRPEEMRRKTNSHAERPPKLKKGHRRLVGAPPVPAPWAPSKTTPKAPSIPKSALALDPACLTPLAELREGQCRWPSGDSARAMLFCGAPTLSDKCSWCAVHARAATVATRPRTRPITYAPRFTTAN